MEERVVKPKTRPVSLVAERAVRYLRDHRNAASVDVVREILATRVSDEDSARRLLETAFSGDPRLAYCEGSWTVAVLPHATLEPTPVLGGAGADRVLVVLEGARLARGRPFELRSVSAVRLRGTSVVGACGGDPSPGAGAAELRRTMRHLLDGGIAVLHDPPGSLAAFERFMGEPLLGALSLRRVACARLGLPARHDLEALAARLRVPWKEHADPFAMAESMDDCLEALRRHGESLEQLRESVRSSAAPIDWSRYAFDRARLDALPRVPGTYRFYDVEGGLLYVGKSKDLHRRLGSYFAEGGPRSPRVQALLDAAHRLEVEPVGSDLEAIMREAALIARRNPRSNVQRRFHVRFSRAERLRSVLILEPALGDWVLRAFLLRDGRLVGRVAIGRRGRGLRRVERILEDHFFGFEDRPVPAGGDDVDVELVGRWLAANRDRVVAFDPTDLRSASDVIDRLRWFLRSGTLLDEQGNPILTR